MEAVTINPWTWLRVAICLLVVVYMVVPLAIILVISFSSAPFLTFPPPGFSLQWYENFASDPSWIRSLLVSIQVMIPTAIFATILGIARIESTHGMLAGCTSEGLVVGQKAAVAIRPEQLRVCRKSETSAQPNSSIDGVISDVVYLGRSRKYIAKLNDGAELIALMQANVRGLEGVDVGSQVTFSWQSPNAKVFAEAWDKP